MRQSTKRANAATSCQPTMTAFGLAAGFQSTSPSLITYAPAGLAVSPNPAPPFPSVSPPPPPPPRTFATGMTVTPFSSTGSPNTFLTDMESRASLSSSSMFISLSFELWLSLLEEGGHALVRVRRAQRERERLPLVLDAEL